MSELKKNNRDVLRSINYLLPQLSSAAGKLTAAGFRKIVKDKNVLLLVARKGGRIVGMGTLVIIFAPAGLRARIEDVVVDEKHRGLGLGKKILEKLIYEARKRRVGYIDLTSRPERIAANLIYKKLGFRRKRTNVYRMGVLIC